MMELMLSREDQRIYLQREKLVRYRRTLNTRHVSNSARNKNKRLVTCQPSRTEEIIT